MSDLVDPTIIEDIVGVRRHQTRHYAKAVSAEQTVYILHSEDCRNERPDLRDCPFSRALDRGIEISDWTEDRPVTLNVRLGGLRPGLPDAAVVAAALAGEYRYHDELSLHAALSSALDSAGLRYAREVPVKGGRIDFIIGTLGHGGVGVEVKVKGPTTALRNQLARYAANDTISELLVVTTRPAHRTVGTTVGGTPVRVLCLSRWAA